MTAMDRKPDMQCNQIFHLKDSMIIYGIYNSDALEQLIETVHRMHNTTSWHKKIFAGKIHLWFEWYLHKDVVGLCAINTILFLTTIREKYVRMYEHFLEQLKIVCQGNKNPFKSLFTYFPFTPIKTIWHTE